MTSELMKLRRGLFVLFGGHGGRQVLCEICLTPLLRSIRSGGQRESFGISLSTGLSFVASDVIVFSSGTSIQSTPGIGSSAPLTLRRESFLLFGGHASRQVS